MNKNRLSLILGAVGLLIVTIFGILIANPKTREYALGFTDASGRGGLGMYTFLFLTPLILGITGFILGVKAIEKNEKRISGNVVNYLIFCAYHLPLISIIWKDKELLSFFAVPIALFLLGSVLLIKSWIKIKKGEKSKDLMVSFGLLVASLLPLVGLFIMSFQR